MAIVIQVPPHLWARLNDHLLPAKGNAKQPEEAAFGYAEVFEDRDTITFDVTDLHLLEPSEFEFQSEYHFTLTDEALGDQIKRAWDRRMSLVEFHCHRPPVELPEFSASDVAGFAEMIPYLVWRLKGAPYAAVVLTTGGLDAVAWIRPGEPAMAVDRVLAGNSVIEPSGRTIGMLRSRHGTV